jgi:hypothetical protein
LPYAWSFLTFWSLNFPTHPRAIVIVTGVVGVFVLYRLLMGYRGEKLASWHIVPLFILWVVVREGIWSSSAFTYRYEAPEAPGGYAICYFFAGQATLFLSYLCIPASMTVFAGRLRPALQRTELEIVRLR